MLHCKYWFLLGQQPEVKQHCPWLVDGWVTTVKNSCSFITMKMPHDKISDICPYHIELVSGAQYSAGHNHMFKFTHPAS
jgi:hypothetical protein